MKWINRNAVVVQPRQPLLDWINRTAPSSPPMTMEDLGHKNTVLLVPEQGSVQEILAWVRPLKRQLFERELESWNTNRSIWPAERTEEVFDQWFELRAHTEVLDAIEEPIQHDAWGPQDLATALVGTWTVVSSPDVDEDALYTETVPHVKLDLEGDGVGGEFHIGPIRGFLWGEVHRNPREEWVQLNLEGMGQAEPVSGDGSIRLRGDRMILWLQFHRGGQFTFECERVVRKEERR